MSRFFDLFRSDRYYICDGKRFSFSLHIESALFVLLRFHRRQSFKIFQMNFAYSILLPPPSLTSPPLSLSLSLPLSSSIDLSFQLVVVTASAYVFIRVRYALNNDKITSKQIEKQAFHVYLSFYVKGKKGELKTIHICLSKYGDYNSTNE